MKNREFDDIIRKLFENFQADSELPDWEALNSRLDQEDLSSNDTFDEEVKELFDEYVPDNAIPQWELMRQSLDDMGDVGFDSDIKEKVEQYEAPYDADTWPILNNKIQTRQWLQRHILTIKTLEICAVILLFISLHNLSLHLSDHDQPLQEAAEQQIPLAQFVEPESIASPLESSAGHQPNGKMNKGAPGTSHKAYADIMASQKDVTSNRDHETVSKRAFRITEFLPAAISMDLSGAYPRSNTIPVQIQSPVPAGNNTDISLAMLDNKQHFLVSGFQHSGNVVRQIMQPDQRRSHTKIYFGISAAADLNSLLIPKDYFYTLGQAFVFTDKTLVASGYSTGASLSFERGRLGFETGMYYASRDYEPDRILYIAEDLDKSTLDFQRISLDIVSMPAHLKYQIDPAGKWKFYALGGIEMHILAAANYDLITRNTFASAAPPGEGGGNSSFFEEVQRVRERILDGTEFKSRSFFTANAALGVERILSTRFSAFFQPTYQHQLSALSVAAEENGQKELKTLSFRLGVRTQLK